tara:strand:+ start:136 stop:1149 length:1014 start_codon:yes stop_codon:yes gene_type:complete
MSQQKRLIKNSFDVIGIGNAIVDILAYTTDSFLESRSLSKGNMTLINEIEAEKLYSEMNDCIHASGGSAANTLTGLSQLGCSSCFIGRVKDDKLGEIFKTEISVSGTFYKTPSTIEGPSTARCFVFITPDAQRTMCTFLGASVSLDPKDLDLSIIKDSKILYLEGYLFDSPAAKEAFFSAAKISKKYGGKVALSLSDSFCVDRHRESFIDLVNNHVDILFANEGELISLYKSSSLKEAMNSIEGKCETAVITCGENGSKVLSKTDCFDIEPYKIGSVIDTTGAGDLYASGFLYGYINEKDLLTCGKLGSICAGQIVTELGPRSKVSLTTLTKKYLEN